MKTAAALKGTTAKRVSPRSSHAVEKHHQIEKTIGPSSWARKTGSAATMMESFYHAFHGLWIGLKQERNVRIHFALVGLVVACGFFLKVDAVSWIALVVAMSMVIMAEYVNTALEHLVDISTDKQYHQSARYAKDTAAAAVLVAAASAAIIGGIVFVPKLLPLIQH